MNICEYRQLYKNEILSIINSKKICNLATINSGTANITPIWFIFDVDENNNFTFYFINMNNETNLNDLSESNKVCIYFENYILDFYMGAYQTITAHGNPHIVTEVQEKEHILNQFKKKYSIDKCKEKISDLTYIKVDIDAIRGRQY
ncbi:MAG: pyridoxamine 5'-phosphate oxidase family protein [Clostridium butyricum]|nr:pyridoxamine 5'-phosphate oxidase family protein [Clostridium butyricum]